MTDDIFRDILIFSVSILLVLLIDFRKSIKYWYILLLFFVIGFVDNTFNTLTMTYPNTQLIKSHIFNNNLYFNWSSKLYSIVFALLLLIPLKNIITPSEIGLRLRQNDKSIKFSLIFILIFFLIASSIGLLSGKTSFDGETLLFTAIMPGLNEELIYRGLLLGLLNKIFERKYRIFKTNFGWGAIITSLIFGILHGFQLGDNLQFQFDFFTIIISGIYGFVYALIRERSGSLVFPVIAHSAVDFFNFFFRMI
ncbi:CPBP family intramembrane metalloprotease [Candidatus Woesearchaeota archaeon]|nr:CPBP family intramembrane metalloprotease [Candidatus Woesearchaeota archaeon]